MNLNIVVTLIMSILTAAGINTSNIDVNSIRNNVINESASVNTEKTSDQLPTYDNDEDTEDTEEDNDGQDDIEENEPTLEEKYQHNVNRASQPEDEEDVWYDVPECTEHEFTVSEYCDGDGYGIEYICNRCGYSYTEPITEEQFMEGLDDEDE